MQTRARLVAVTVLFFSCLLAGSTGQSPTEKSQTSPVPIPREPLGLKLGGPMSTRALVPRPIPIRGLVSWTLEGRKHRGYIVALAVSPDGKLVATGGLDGTIRLWEFESGKLLKALVGHDSYCYSLAFSPDGQTLASGGSFDATVRLWDVQSGYPLRVLKGHKSYISHVAWAPDGKSLVVAGGQSGFVTHWDVVKGVQLKTFEVGQAVYALAFSPDGKQFSAALKQSGPQLLDLTAGKAATTFGPGNEDALAVAFSPDGKLLATGHPAATRIWNAETGSLMQTIAVQAHSLAWLADGKMLALAASSGTPQLYDASNGKLLKSLTGTCLGITLMPDGRTLLSRNYTAIAFLDVSDGKALRTWDMGAQPPAHWSPGRPLLTGLGTLSIRLWDAATMKPLHTLEGHTAPVNAIAWSRDGKTLATGCADKIVRLFETGSGKLLHKLERHKEAVSALTWSNDGKHLASGSADKAIKLWDASSGKLLHTLDGHQKQVQVLAWMPGGRNLASAGLDGAIIIWDGASGKPVRRWDDFNGVYALAWSPDAKMIATGTTDPIVRVWNAGAGKLIHSFEVGGSPPAVYSLAFSPNGALLASGRGNHTLQIWDMRTGKTVHSLQTMAPVQAVAWSPGSTTIASSNGERTVRFWDAASGLPRATVLCDEKHLIAISGEGHYRAEPAAEDELVYVVQTEKGQETLAPAEFGTRFKWKNNPALVRLSGN